jgi:hypothetical protein
MVIDFHVHIDFYNGHKDVADLLKADDEFGIDGSVVFCQDNAFTLGACKRHRDRLIPFGWVEWGRDDPRKIDQLADEGVKGLKVLNPAFDYNDARLDAWWSRAEARRLPVLVHTGIVAAGESVECLVPPALTDTSRMQVLYLDGPLRRFPRLVLAAAHLGNPDQERGAMLVRWHPNLYFDLSGSGLLRHKHPYWKDLFWWDKPSRFSKDIRYSKALPTRPFQKLVFGSDVPYRLIGQAMAEQRALLEALEQPKEIIAQAFGGTAARLLGIKGE